MSELEAIEQVLADEGYDVLESANLAQKIAQALRSTDPQCVVVKELEWGMIGGTYVAGSVGRSYRIFVYKGMSLPYKAEGVPSHIDERMPDHYSTLDDAKAACQADFERRILSSISLRSGAEIKAEGAREALEKAANAMLKVPCETRDDEFITWVEAANFVRSQSSEGEG